MVRASRRQRRKLLRREVGGLPVWAITAIFTLVVLLGGWAFAGSPQRVSANPDWTPRPGIAQASAIAVLFIGDSYSAGTGLPVLEYQKRWTTLVSRDFGWVEMNLAQGGTGYVGTGTGCGYSSCQNYLQVIQGYDEDFVPDVVVISGGRNDNPDDNYYAAVSEVIGAAQAQWPEARIYVTTPLWDDDPLPEKMHTIMSAVEAAVDEHPGVELVDWGLPLEGRPELIVDDGIHPNETGYRVLADAFERTWPSLTADTDDSP